MSPKSKGKAPVFFVTAAVLLLALGGGVWLVHNLVNSTPPAAKKVAQEIQVIRPPPPPPDVKPPPPPPEEEVDIPEPEQLPDPSPSDEPPPGEQLGLDADGTGGGDSFGLVGRKGGRDLLASGGSAYTWYGGLIKNEILDQLGDEQKARTGNYSVMVKVWVRADGTVERIKLASSSGSAERDRAIETALGRVNRVSQGPPANMPQPISFRIVSRA